MQNGGVLVTDTKRSRGVTDLGMKILKEKHLSFHNSYHPSIKDSKKLEIHLWGFKSEIQARNIPDRLSVQVEN